MLRYEYWSRVVTLVCCNGEVTLTVFTGIPYKWIAFVSQLVTG